MISIDIPDFGRLQLAHLVLDYNGTLAFDGSPLPGVAHEMGKLAKLVTIHVVTADTFGRGRQKLAVLPLEVVVLPAGAQDEAKRDLVRRLGAAGCCAVGNGRNDQLMLAEAALGICIMGGEGAAAQTLLAADVVCGNIRDALALLTNPLRLTATLRL